MKLLLTLTLVLLAIFCLRSYAQAATCTVPNIFVNGQASDANTVNANFTALQTCGNGVDNTQVGILGFYASQVKPTTVAQAIFGGGQTYGFTNGLNVTGNLNLASVGASLLLCTDGSKNVTTTGCPVSGVGATYTAGGATLTGLHNVRGTCAFSGANFCVVTLAGAAVFTNGNTYACYASTSDTPSITGINNQVAGGFTINAGASGTFIVAWFCTGS